MQSVEDGTVTFCTCEIVGDPNWLGHIIRHPVLVSTRSEWTGTRVESAMEFLDVGNFKSISSSSSSSSFCIGLQGPVGRWGAFAVFVVPGRP